MVVATVAMSWSGRNTDQVVIDQQNQQNESTSEKSTDNANDEHHRFRRNVNLLTAQAAVSQQQDQSLPSDCVTETSTALNALVLNHRHRHFVASSPQKLDGDDAAAISVTQDELDLITEWDLISPPSDEPTSPADEGVVLNSSVPCTDHLIVSSSSSAYSSAVSSISSPLSVSTASNFISSYSSVEASVCKKRVRFADAHGKPLAQVCTFANSPVGSIDSANSTPVATTLSRIFNLVQAPSQAIYCNGQQQNMSSEGDVMELLFPDPLSSYSALTERLRTQHVALESVSCRSGCIRGMIRVRNLSFSKHVFVRVTFDHWATSNDWTADYFPIISPSEGRSEYDLFEFSVPIPPHLMPGTIVDFCICYKCGDQPGEFWDNNGGNNYSLRYRPFTNLYYSQRRTTQQPAPKQTITSQHLLLKTRTASELEAERAQRIRDFVWSEFASWNGGSALAVANPHQNAVPVMPNVRMAPTMVTSVSTSHAGQDMPLPYW